jgi:hypothetical protein
MPDQAAAFREAALTRHPLIEVGAAQVGAGHSASLPTEREVIGLICRTVAEVERARVEFFASLPTMANWFEVRTGTMRISWLPDLFDLQGAR